MGGAPPVHPADRRVARAVRQDPARRSRNAYDLIVNGKELGGGSFRIHEADLQARVFELLGLTGSEQRARFGFLLDAFAMGAPPHGGIALGIDRLTMVLAGEPNLRDVITFPKNQAGLDPMSGAPTGITERAAAGARAEGGRRGAAVSARVVQRLLALGAVAMLAGLVAVAVVERREPEPVPAPRGAVAAGRRLVRGARRAASGGHRRRAHELRPRAHRALARRDGIPSCPAARRCSCATAATRCSPR